MAVIDFMMINKSFFFFGGYAVTTSQVNVIPFAQGARRDIYLLPSPQPGRHAERVRSGEASNLKSDL
jgi:hypothetical protein